MVGSYVESGSKWEANLADEYRIGNRAVENKIQDFSLESATKAFGLPAGGLDASMNISMYVNTRRARNYGSDLVFRER